MPENIDGTAGYTGGAYSKPSAKDSGSDVFQVLEDFMERMSNHTHQGRDSEIISHTITKTPFSTAAATGNWTPTGDNTDQKYVDIDVTSNSLSVNNDGTGGATPNDVNWMFFYVVDDIDGISSPGHQRFYPEYEWTEYDTMRISTNIFETINDAATSPRVYLKAY